MLLLLLNSLNSHGHLSIAASLALARFVLGQTVIRFLLHASELCAFGVRIVC